jgi:putative hydroxymethylpyrimidine transport system substrate-binding protein
MVSSDRNGRNLVARRRPRPHGVGPHGVGPRGVKNPVLRPQSPSGTEKVARPARWPWKGRSSQPGPSAPGDTAPGDSAPTRACLHSLTSRRTIVKGALAGAAALASSNRVRTTGGRAQEPTRVTVALDWYPNANHAGLYLALERGYFAAEGLEVELYTPSDPTLVLQTVGAGEDTLGISYQTDLLLARAQDVPVVSVAALVQHPLLAVMALETAGIARPADLVGKTVGYPGIPSQEAILATMLETDGAALDDVELVNVGFELVPATISGNVVAVMGAYWTHETILAEREGYPVDVLRVEEWGVPDYYELVLVASDETVAERGEMVASFLQAMQRGYVEAAAEPAAALDALAAASQDLDRAVEEEGITLLIPVWTDGVPVFGTQTAARWEEYATWMVERGLIPADLDVESAYNADLLPVGTGTPAS